MEVIIRDEKMPKNCYECSYLEICSLKPNFEPTISKCPLKSLTQHDAELKAKWCDELMNWITDAENRVTECETWNMLQELRERQKLEEMKGEK